MELRGSKVVITGASSGIGKSVAIEMAKRGANLVLAARRAEALEAVAAECRRLGVEVSVVVTDVTKVEDCRQLAAAAGDVDVLVNNAGFALFDNVVDARPEDITSMMQTNFFGAYWCTQAFLPRMIERKRGKIVIVASIVGLMGYAGMSGYCASKFALVGWAEALRDEVAGSGLEIALVCPGTTQTEFFVTADKKKMPAASKLIGTMSAERVARAVCKSAEDGKARRILPFTAMLYIRFKEIAPGLAHFFMRHVSRLLG